MTNEIAEAPVETTDVPRETTNPFEELSWNQLRRWATANGILAGGGVKWDELKQTCFEVCPDFVPEVEAPAPTKYVVANQHTRDATEILDGKGNKLCTVYRLGREIDGVREELPMDKNVSKIVDTLKQYD